MVECSAFIFGLTITQRVLCTVGGIFAVVITGIPNSRNSTFHENGT